MRPPLLEVLKQCSLHTQGTLSLRQQFTVRSEIHNQSGLPIESHKPRRKHRRWAKLLREGEAVVVVDLGSEVSSVFCGGKGPLATREQVPHDECPLKSHL